METWHSLKEKLKSWTGKKAVYRNYAHQKVSRYETEISYDEYTICQNLLNHLGINTLGVNKPARQEATYEMVIKGLEDFKKRAIKRAESDYTPKLEVESRNRIRAEEKLERVRSLVAMEDFTTLKNLVGKGEI